MELILYFLADNVRSRSTFGKPPSEAQYILFFYLQLYPPFHQHRRYIHSSFQLFGNGEDIARCPITAILSIEHFPTKVADSWLQFIWFTMRFEDAILGLFTRDIRLVKIGHVEYIGWLRILFFLKGLIVVAVLS